MHHGIMKKGSRFYQQHTLYIRLKTSANRGVKAETKEIEKLPKRCCLQPTDI